jgi:antitoxin-like ribbon-helix-helix protein
MSKRPNLSALASAAGSVRVPRQTEPAEELAPQDAPAPAAPRAAVAPSRASAKPITAFYPEEVRDQLKILAAEQRRSMENMLAEALNELFAKYGKPEIAPAVDRRRALLA